MQFLVTLHMSKHVCTLMDVFISTEEEVVNQELIKYFINL